MQLLIAASYISQFSGKNFFFNKSPDILMDALMVRLQEILNLSDEQLTAFATDFEARLPEYLRNALHFKAVAA